MQCHEISLQLMLHDTLETRIIFMAISQYPIKNKYKLPIIYILLIFRVTNIFLCFLELFLPSYLYLESN